MWLQPYEFEENQITTGLHYVDLTSFSFKRDIEGDFKQGFGAKIQLGWYLPSRYMQMCFGKSCALRYSWCLHKNIWFGKCTNFILFYFFSNADEAFQERFERLWRSGFGVGCKEVSFSSKYKTLFLLPLRTANVSIHVWFRWHDSSKSICFSEWYILGEEEKSVTPSTYVTNNSMLWKWF